MQAHTLAHTHSLTHAQAASAMKLIKNMAKTQQKLKPGSARKITQEEEGEGRIGREQGVGAAHSTQ